FDTGVDLTTGQLIKITATGRATYGADLLPGGQFGVPQTDPDGQRYFNGSPIPPKFDPNAILPSAPIGALLARINGGSWWPVGSEYSDNVNTSGRLFLLYNDSASGYG